MAIQYYRPKRQIDFSPNPQQQEPPGYSVAPFRTLFSQPPIGLNEAGRQKAYPQPTDREIDRKANPFQLKFEPTKGFAEAGKEKGIYVSDQNFAKDSTAIAAIKYSPSTGDLKVRFKKGKKFFWYPEVPAEIVKEWGNKNTPSKGKFYWDKIRRYSIYYPGTGKGKPLKAKNDDLNLMRKIVKNS